MARYYRAQTVVQVSILTFIALLVVKVFAILLQYNFYIPLVDPFFRMIIGLLLGWTGNPALSGL